MSVFGRYLKYRLKDSALRSIILTVFSVLTTLNTVANANSYKANVSINDSCLSYLCGILIIFSTLIPMLETKCFKNRPNLDTLYFFPIKRVKMAWVHYLSGLIQMAFIYTVTYFSAFIYLAVKTWYYDLKYMIPYFFLSLLFGVVIYSIFIFIFGQANTVQDGVVFSFLWMFAIGIVLIAMEYVTNLNLHSSSGIIYKPLVDLTEIFMSRIEIYNSYYSDPDSYSGHVLEDAYNRLYWFAIWGVLAVGAVFGYIKTFVEKGAQKIGEISDSWFGYRTLIPLYGYSLLVMSSDVSGTLSLILFIAMIIGYIIYRRTFRIKLSDIFMVLLGVVPLLIGIWAAKQHTMF